MKFIHKSKTSKAEQSTIKKLIPKLFLKDKWPSG